MTTTTNRVTITLVTASLAAALVLGACSSSDGAAGSATTAATAKTTASTTRATSHAPADRSRFCNQLKTAFGDYRPGFDAIFENGNDHPTLEEWAAFLPKPTAEFDAVIAKVEAVEPPADDPEITRAFATAVRSFAAMSQSYHDSAVAAKAGNQAEFDNLEHQNQDTNSPAMQKAMATVGRLCGFPQS